MLRHLLFYIAYLIEHITTILIKHLLNYIEFMRVRQAFSKKRILGKSTKKQEPRNPAHIPGVDIVNKLSTSCG